MQEHQAGEGEQAVACSLRAVPRGDLAFRLTDFCPCIWLGAALGVWGCLGNA